MKHILIALALIAGVAPAVAQTKQPTQKLFNLPKGPIGTVIDKATGAEPAQDTSAKSRQKILETLAKPFRDLADFIGDDAENAITLSTSVPGVKDGHGQQCWIAARNFTSVFKAHPLPLTGQAMTDLEALRLLAISSKQLCENTHCTQVFTDFKNMAITVAQVGFGAIGATAVRSAPSLQDVCTQVPNIALVDPLDPVPPAPGIKPVLPSNATDAANP